MLHVELSCKRRLLTLLYQPEPVTCSSCRYDYVEVYNGGDDLSPMLGKFCGKIAPSPIISSGSQLLIKFVSDYETHGAGFSVRYEVFKTGACQRPLPSCDH